MTKATRFITTIIGLLFLVAGTYYIKAYGAPEGAIRVLPYLAIGIGCGLFGYGFGRSVSDMAIKSDPAAQKRVRIEESQRKIELRERKAFSRNFEAGSIIKKKLCLSLLSSISLQNIVRL